MCYFVSCDISESCFFFFLTLQLKGINMRWISKDFHSYDLDSCCILLHNSQKFFLHSSFVAYSDRGASAINVHDRLQS